VGKLEKLIELFLRQPPEVRFADVLYLLEAFGYIEQPKGSHHTFSDPDGKTIVIPKVSGQKVKRVYVKRIIELLDLNSTLAASDPGLDSVVAEVESEENSDD
jgi:predicted RNA binding protein YcfA (HicA-like mRNA interferase family)